MDEAVRGSEVGGAKSFAVILKMSSTNFVGKDAQGRVKLLVVGLKQKILN